MNNDLQLSPTARTYLDDVARLTAHSDREASEALIAGIREELAGLDDDAAKTRLYEIGTPHEVTAEIRHTSAPVGSSGPDADPVWYTVVTITLLLVGGFVVPVAGYIAGLVMLWMSKSWRLRHQLAGTLLWPVIAIASLSVWMLSFQVETDGDEIVALFEPISAGVAILALVLCFAVPIWLARAAARSRQGAMR